MWAEHVRILVASLALASCAVADQPGPDTTANPVRQVRIEISDYQLVFAPVSINGKEVLALIDTGSAAPVRLSATLARELKLVLTPDPTSQVQGLDGRRIAVSRARVDTLALGGAQDRDMQIEVAGDRLETIAAQVGTRFDVVLGWGFLSRHNFRLDYRNRVLQFGDRVARPNRTGAAIRYTIVNRLPVIAATLDNRDVRLLLDSGAPMCSIDSGFAQTSVGQIVPGELLLGTTRVNLSWRVKDLSVTRQALGTVGTLGNNLLGQYAVYFDTRNQTIYLD